MKPRTVVRVSELKNENNSRNRTYDMRSEDRSEPAAIIVIFISAQRYNYFLNHQTKNRKKSLMDAKIWETIQKGPKMHHKGD